MIPSTAIVVGAGIVGLALAKALAERGCRVVVFERHERAVGASLRSPGALWLLGEANGRLLELARRSRRAWQEFCEAADVWYESSGCLVPAYSDDEMALLQEFCAASGQQRDCQLLNPAQTRERCAQVQPRGLRGALWSGEEAVLDPRVALRQLPLWLADRLDVEFRWKHAVTRVAHPYVWSGGRRHAADAIYLAGGADLPALYPQLFAEGRLSLLRRQVVRLAAQPDGFRLGCQLHGVAGLAAWPAFAALPAAQRLAERAQADSAECGPDDLLLLQNGSGEILASHALSAAPAAATGDSLQATPLFDALRRLTLLPDCRIAQSWQTVHACSAGDFAIQPEAGVSIVAAPAGPGLSLAFGLAEEVAAASA
ncbi:FAD dependent oxidoreductase TIGR03364 [Tahibacter aquaticus]|uniref:FAD dependent oxidoreductase TIGR03364 n=1 Tax=Tahibacter aquaticus TaxID=520092 RepID=A0A4R6Z9L0_9GAMM|nr:FAD-dependent oxidoreductase [Tahibacter aquaticus]TDR48404.1 FAD dependent oxidoreductase TIGR03364 [Tahibacter aquaticus]